MPLLKGSGTIKKIQFDDDKFHRPSRVKPFKQASAYDLNSFLDKDDFKIDWNRRRVRIDFSLIFLGGLLSVIVCGLMISVFREKPIDPNLSYVFSGAVWAIMLAFMTILGTYCFGPSFEAGNYRRATATMFASMNKNPMPGLKATTTTETNIQQGDDGSGDTDDGDDSGEQEETEEPAKDTVKKKQN